MSDDIGESCMEGETKVNIEETTINLNSVKKEPDEVFDFERNSQSTQYRIPLEYVNIKFEEGEDNLVGFMKNDVIMENAIVKLENIKEEDESANDFNCSKCSGYYKGYCLKCSTLSHILNRNVSFPNSNTKLDNMPPDILEIRETSMGKRAFLLRSLPKDVIFGPFEGILGIESTMGYSWKINDKKFSNIDNGNWMKHVDCVKSALFKNLDIFQSNGDMYFQTNREVMEGEELLVYFDDGEIQTLDKTEECLYTPQKQVKLAKIFACTLCCLGFRSDRCLMEHKRKCPRGKHTRSAKDFELVECHYCKLWLEKFEHQEYHVASCLEKHHSTWSIEEIEDHVTTKDNKGEYNQRDSLQLPIKNKLAKGITKDYPCFSRSELESSSNNYTLAKHENNEPAQNEIENKYSERSCQINHKAKLDEHLNTHNNIKPLQCDICLVKFTTKGSLRSHIKNKHTENSIEKRYKCSECAYRTKHKGHLNVHLNIHNGIKPFQCDVCLNRFSSKANLKTHTKNQHTENTIYKKYKCTECSYQTNYKTSFTVHLNTHNGIQPFQCGICMRKFTVKRNLKIHVKNKHTTGETGKDYKCPECPYETNIKASLKSHRYTHNSVKAFQCDICMTKFTQKSNLKSHIKNNHTETAIVKKFECSECSFHTKYKEHLRRHLNAHNGIKPFQCDLCTQTFSDKRNLKVHVKNKHSTIKDFKCSECPYHTNYRKNFQRHLNAHSSIKPIECGICMQKFADKRNLKIHVKKKHTTSETAKK